MAFKQKVTDWYQGIPDKKKYFEFVSAVLTIPVLITVILLNLNSLNKAKASVNDPAPTLAAAPSIQLSNKPSKTPTVTPVSCQNVIGPVTILSPQEDELITDDVVVINLDITAGYCPVAWSYSLDGVEYSEYTQNQISLYNLTPGKKKLHIRLKSLKTGKVIEIVRDFVYKSDSQPTPTLTIIPTSTPTILTPTPSI